MSTRKENKRLGWGGLRRNAGHPKTGIKKSKICVSVDKENWNTAKKRWNDKPSRLIDGLVSSYLKTGGKILEMRATI